jgi:hypothetical protein
MNTNKIVFENLIDSSTGLPVELDISDVHPVDKKTMMLDLQFATLAGKDAAIALTEMFNAPAFADE